MELKNYMETAVDHILPNFIKAFPTACSCDICMLDIKAYALNHLKPHYLVTEEGELWSKIDEMYVQSEADIMKALVDAITVVNSSKRHD